jgi:hypothetical protein
MRNPLVALLGDAIAFALRQPEVIEALRKVATPLPPDTKPSTALLTKKELAIELEVSTSTIDRMDREGAPHIFVGDHKRYSLCEFRTWAARRGKKATKALPSSGDNVDITDVALSGGLRATE